MNKIVVNFTICVPAPARGYNLQWRVLNSGNGYIDAGNFFVSPAIFYDTVNSSGTLYEGFIRSNCGTSFSNSVSWQSPGIESGGGFIFNGNVNNRTVGPVRIESLYYGGVPLNYLGGDALPINGPGSGTYSLPYLTSGDTLTILILGGSFTQLRITDNAGDHIPAGSGSGLYYQTLTINPMFPIFRIELT